MPKTKIKVIFTQDVPGQARKFEAKEVATGYFRNFLLPRGLASVATEDHLESLKDKQAQIEADRSAKIEKANKQKQDLEDLVLNLSVKSGDEGEVYSSISKEDIEKVLKEKGFEDFTVDLDKPIREIGEDSVKVIFSEGISGEVRIKVSAGK